MDKIYEVNLLYTYSNESHSDKYSHLSELNCNGVPYKVYIGFEDGKYFFTTDVYNTFLLDQPFEAYTIDMLEHIKNGLKEQLPKQYNYFIFNVEALKILNKIQYGTN